MCWQGTVTPSHGVKSFYTLVKIPTSSWMKSKNIKLEAAGKCVYVYACVRVC